MDSEQIPKISFLPPEFFKKTENIEAHGLYEKCALVGIILGALAVISWIVILFGIIYSVVGIVLSILGLNSIYKKYARVGLALSILGLVLSLVYVFAISKGLINFNYFTGDFWR